MDRTVFPFKELKHYLPLGSDYAAAAYFSSIRSAYFWTCTDTNPQGIVQSYAVFPHMTVEQNIGYGLKKEKVAKAEIQTRVKDMLELVQLSDFAKRKPEQLSGGQQQRVALARALIKRPKVLLRDEPRAALGKK